MTIGTEQKKLHRDLTNVGLRAQATAAGLVQLCKELQAQGILPDEAVERIKAAIADEITIGGPRVAIRAEFRREICERLDSIFAGEKRLGPAEDIAFGPEQTS